jgi:hypothetical protein
MRLSSAWRQRAQRQATVADDVRGPAGVRGLDRISN